MNNLLLLSNALDYIEENICERITAEDVANACYCSKSYLQKIFKYVNGYSIKEYIIKRRITKAAKDLMIYPERTVLDIAIQYCYNSSEAFTRAFQQVWHCNPSGFRREARFTDLYPMQRLPIESGDVYMDERRHVDISELYDLFVERRACYFVYCDVKSMSPINEISRKAGDLAILESLKRLEKVSEAEDIIFRIGGDEFVILTNEKEEAKAAEIAKDVLAMNGKTFLYEGREIPLHLHAGITKYQGNRVKYDDLFTSLHNAIKVGKTYSLSV